MTNLIRHAVAMATFIAFGTANAQTQTQTIASMRLDLSDLKVDVASLVPGEPTQPLISLFYPQPSPDDSANANGLQSVIWRGTPYTPTYSDRVSVAGSLLPTESLVRTSADGLSQVSISPTAISMSTALTDQSVQSLVPSYGDGFDQRFVTAVKLDNTLIYGTTSADPMYWQVTLAPQSQLTLSGVAKMALNMDVDRMGAILSPLADVGSRPSAILVAGLSLSAVSYDPVEGFPISNVSAPFSEIQYDFDTSQNVLLSASGPDVNKEESFSLKLLNDRDVEQMYYLQFTAVNEAVFIKNGRPELVDGDLGNTTVVPEPSTYALMGLGLVGLSVVARQRRRS
jgi:hypothetical protein